MISVMKVSVVIRCFLGRSLLRRRAICCSAGCSAGCSSYSTGCSSLVSDSGPVSIRKYGFTVMDLKLVGLLGSCTLQVSPLIASRL